VITAISEGYGNVAHLRIVLIGDLIARWDFGIRSSLTGKLDGSELKGAADLGGNLQSD